MASVLNQPAWGELEGLIEDVAQFEPTKQVVMVHEVTESESPKRIVTSSGDVVFASASDAVCYSPGEHLQPTLDEYDHWVLNSLDFAQHYLPWDAPERQFSQTEQHLMELGCKPFYRVFSATANKSHSDEPESSNSPPEISFWRWLFNLIKETD